ncbi:hypothetical protein DVH24_001774 [Malus domestica]|uniref:Uncharacterized protein n=1 Tax=Malus domestica TaxID=3750 RepID=A0A498I3Z5_MALDO|nr:hypothetical protein DVH24_001774 [Malus domestica]
MRKCVLRIERYHHKRVPDFEEKSRADAYAELRFDIGGLVQCSTKFKSWKMVPGELKKSMAGELHLQMDHNILDSFCDFKTFEDM